MTIKIFIKKIIKKLRGGLITLHPDSKSVGRVLLSYKTEPFFEFEKKEHLHTNIWECREIARIFLRLGYIVDVIDWYDRTFKPRRKYQYLVDLGLNIDRMTPFLGKECVKIFHATTSHWLFNNQAENQRLIELQKRRRVTLRPRRALVPGRNIEVADFSTVLGNEVTTGTYDFAGKKMSQIPLSTTHTYPFPEHKDLEKAKKNFIWLGGVGMVHKGLDLVLEAFCRLPEYQLFVFGDVQKEKDFESLYWRELYQTDNIKTFGRVDVGGEVFTKAAEASIALIYPSCSEGQSGAVVTCMHAGLIPAISYYSGVGIDGFGVLIKENTVEGVIQTIRSIALMPNPELEKRSRATWEYARKYHTRERFSEAFTRFIKMLETKKND